MCGVFCVLVVAQAFCVCVSIVIEGLTYICRRIPRRCKYQCALLLGSFGSVKLAAPVVFIGVYLNPEYGKSKLILAVFESGFALVFG